MLKKIFPPVRPVPVSSLQDMIIDNQTNIIANQSGMITVIQTLVERLNTLHEIIAQEIARDRLVHGDYTLADIEVVRQHLGSDPVWSTLLDKCQQEYEKRHVPSPTDEE